MNLVYQLPEGIIEWGDHVVSEYMYNITVPQILSPCYILSPLLILTPHPIPTDGYLTFSDPDSLSGVVPSLDDTFFGPINVSEGNSFIFVGEHREIYVRKIHNDFVEIGSGIDFDCLHAPLQIGSNGYFTFGRGLTDFSSSNFPQTDYIVAPFWVRHWCPQRREYQFPSVYQFQWLYGTGHCEPSRLPVQ